MRVDRRHLGTSRSGILALTGLVLVGFAANSLLARQALATGAIDAATYTLVRLLSGAVMLLVLAIPQDAGGLRSAVFARGSASRWLAAIALAVYAATFSYAYLRIGAALGALVLFPTVKLALLGHGFAKGERPARAEWVGAALALSGLAVLTRPGIGRPDLAGVGLMIAAGLAWAVYTAVGQRVERPFVATRDNFVLAVGVALPLFVPAIAWGHATAAGLTLGAASGAVTSALSYALWYRVVPHLTGMQMGLAQLSVPVLAGLGAVIVLGESLTQRLLLAAALIFAGVVLALGWRAAFARRASAPP